MSARVITIIAVLTLLGALAAPQVWGDIITIDGKSDDWATPDYKNHDTVGDVCYSEGGNTYFNYAFDIEWNYYEYSEEANPRYAFAFLTVDNLGAGDSGQFMEILLNTKIGAGVGGTWRSVPDLEYYITWNLVNGNPAQLWKWTGSAWQQVANPTISVRRGTNAAGENPKLVELSILTTDLGVVQQMMWAAYLDNAGRWSDDYCPDEGAPDIPEPGTLALGALALMGGVFAGRRTRRS